MYSFLHYLSASPVTSLKTAQIYKYNDDNYEGGKKPFNLAFSQYELEGCVKSHKIVACLFLIITFGHIKVIAEKLHLHLNLSVCLITRRSLQ